MACARSKRGTRSFAFRRLFPKFALSAAPLNRQVSSKIRHAAVLRGSDCPAFSRYRQSDSIYPPSCCVALRHQSCPQENFSSEHSRFFCQPSAWLALGFDRSSTLWLRSAGSTPSPFDPRSTIWNDRPVRVTAMTPRFSRSWSLASQ